MKLPDDPKLAGKFLQSHVDTEAAKVRRGMLGSVFGMDTEKPGNIGVFAFIVAAIIFLVVLYIEPTSDFPRREALVLVGGIMTTALGFVFGRASS